MNKQTNHLVLFSVSSGSALDNANTEMVHRVLQSEGLSFTPATGVTKQWGKERSFLVVLPEYNTQAYHTQFEYVLDLCIQFKQQALLYVDNERTCTLWNLETGNKTQLGVLKPVSQADALAIGDFTMVGEDRYYSVL